MCATSRCDADNFCDATLNENLRCSPLDCSITVDEMVNNMPHCQRVNNRCECTQCQVGTYTSDCNADCPEPDVAVLTDSVVATICVYLTIAYLYYQNVEVDHTASVKEAESAASEIAGDVESVKEKQSEIEDAASEVKLSSETGKEMRAKARMFTQAFSRKAKAVQRILVARMQVLSAILASITWGPDVPQILLDILDVLSGFFTFDVPGLLSTPDCLYDRSKVFIVPDDIVNISTSPAPSAPATSRQANPIDSGALSPLDKWYMALILPFALMLLVAVPCLFYKIKHDNDKHNEDYERKATGWNNVCTQLSFVWIFATVVTTALTILDCDQGTEGRLIMDSSLLCPLSNPANFTNTSSLGTTIIAPNPFPAVLGISMLVVYCLGLVGFLYTAIKVALTGVIRRRNLSIKMARFHRSSKERRTREVERMQKVAHAEKQLARAQRTKRNDNSSEDLDAKELKAQTELENIMKQSKIECKEDEAQAKQEQQEIHMANKKLDEDEEWKTVGWLMEDYRYPIFELYNVLSRGVIIMASTIMFPEIRFYTHISTMSLSLIIIAASRPYVDYESNLVSILFGVIDVLGAISAWQSSAAFLTNGGEQSLVFQIIFILSLFVALIVVVVLAFKATLQRLRVLHQTFSSRTNPFAIWRSYSTCETAFLFPFLFVIFFVTLFACIVTSVLSCIVYVACCRCFFHKKSAARMQQDNVTKIQPHQKFEG